MIPVNELLRGFKLYKNEYEQKVLEVLNSGWYVLGKEVERFENLFSAKLGDDYYTIGVDNGLNAIKIGLIAAGVGKGDEVIVQANGYIATVLAVIHCGAVPIFVEPNKYYGMNVISLEKAITQKTKAVLVTHLYGLVSDMDKIVEVCKKYNLLLFEDCAQAHFAKYMNKYAGTFGKAGFFSFYPTKNLGAFGDGGAIISRDKSFVEKVKALRNYGSDYRYHNIYLGYNSRLDELQAGLLQIKLKHYDELLDNRTKIANLYLKGINNKKIRLPLVPNTSIHVWYQFVIQVNSRNEFINYMKKSGIGTDILWETPPYLQPAMKNYNIKNKKFLITEKICKRIVSLPMMDYMYDDEINYIIEIINKY